MNLEYISNLLMQLSPLKVIHHQCSRIITAHSQCGHCMKVCPKQAITITATKIHMEQCVLCGKCVTACPNDVFRLEQPLQPTMDHTLILSCAALANTVKKSVKHLPINILNCFAQLHPEHIVARLASGEKIIFFYDSFHCQQCFQFQLDQWNQSLEQYKEAFPHIAWENLLILSTAKQLQQLCADKKQGHTVNEGRRNLFGKALSSAKTLPTTVTAHALGQFSQENASLNFSIPVGTSMRKQYLKQACQQTAPALEQALPFSPLRTNHCNVCGICSRLCPTGALSQRKQGEQKQLLYAPHLCNHCDICTSTCPTKALYFHQWMTVGDLVHHTTYLIAKSQLS